MVVGQDCLLLVTTILVDDAVEYVGDLQPLMHIEAEPFKQFEFISIFSQPHYVADPLLQLQCHLEHVLHPPVCVSLLPVLLAEVIEQLSDSDPLQPEWCISAHTWMRV